MHGNGDCNSGDGLEEIGVAELTDADRFNTDYAFNLCSGLATVIVDDGLEEIGEQAFKRSEALERIMTPCTVKGILQKAFDQCSSLINVEFCTEIEVFVSCEAMRDRWNQGFHIRSLSTYCSLVKCDIPIHLGLVRMQSWQMNTFDMLRCIPTILQGCE